MAEKLLIVLIALALIGWRLRRLARLIRSERPLWQKALVGGVIGLAIIARTTQLLTAHRADASTVPKAATHPTTPSSEASKLIGSAELALAQCDTTTANHAFQQLAAVGIEMMRADSLNGDALFYQGLAQAGLRDTVSARVLNAEALRLDTIRHAAVRPARAALMQRITTNASNPSCGKKSA